MILALAVGWYTREKMWETVLIMLTPTMFVGGVSHGRPWNWLVVGLAEPLVLAYFVQNMAPIVAAYIVSIGFGRFVRLRLQRPRERRPAVWND